MTHEFVFEDKAEFLSKLEELTREGVPRGRMSTFTPYPVHEVDEILQPRKSHMRFFTLFGALAGLLMGFAFTIYASKSYPLIVSGKPIVGIPAFVIIAFALTILFGSLISFAGFLILARLPDPHRIADPLEYGNQFAILIEDEA